MSFSDVHNGGARGRSKRAAGNNTALAAGTGDATEVNGAWIDRKSAQGIALSAKLVIEFTTTLAGTKTLGFGVNFQDATDISGAGAADYGDVYARRVAATGGSGGSTETDTFELDVDLGGARQFIRAQITPDLDASGTDTAAWSAIYMLYGDQRGPQTKSPVNVASPDAI